MNKKNVKTFSIVFYICLLIINVGCKKEAEPKEKQTKSIKIICEDVVLPLVSDLVRDYNLNNEPVVTVESAPRETALVKLGNSEVDVLIGYVPTKDQEIESEPLAYDGIGIIVNPDNKLDSLSIQELKMIYTGKIVSWDKLKGESNTIVPIAFKDMLNSAQVQFSTKVMDIPVKEEIGSNIKYASSVEEMKNLIAKDKNAIGFIPGQWYNEDTKFLKVNGIDITMSNIKNELYKLRFSINLYYAKEKKDSLKDFFQYFKSDDGKKIIRKYCIEA